MQAHDFSQRTLLSFVGRSSSSSCGYCKLMKHSTNIKLDDGNDDAEDEELGTSVNFGLWTHRLAIDDYLTLINRGWRRSGRYLYKPIMEETCCPQYTIRLDVHKFRLSRTQKRVLRTMRDFLKNDKRPAKAVIDEEKDNMKINATTNSQILKYTLDKNSVKLDNTATNKSSVFATNLFEQVKKNRDLKKKILRRKQAEERLRAKGVDLDEYKKQRILKEELRRRNLESFLQNDENGEWKHKLEIRLVSLLSDSFSHSFQESHALYKKYQQVVHKDDDVSESTYKCFLECSPFCFPTVKNAQGKDRKIEKDVRARRINSNSRSGSSLAIDNDLAFTSQAQHAYELGAYHMQYILDGKIIAVGVIDILPKCISSKYFFYDPEYKFLSMGTYSALREIELTKKALVYRPALHYYYMGFYVYDCPKMRYKGRFRPSELLCDRTFEWFSLSECEKMLMANDGKFTVFKTGESADKQLEATDTEAQQDVALADTALLVCDGQTAMRFKELRDRFVVPDLMAKNLSTLAHYAGSLISDVYLMYKLEY